MNHPHATSGGHARPGCWVSLSYAERLRLIHRLTAPAIEDAMTALAPAPGSRGLDAGCGAGTHAHLLSRAAGHGAQVIGLDLSLPNLTEVPTSGGVTAGRIIPVNGNLLSLPFRDRSFDWVWCADVLWPEVVADNPVNAVRELARAVQPGGTVALLFWSGQTLLPGYPELETRLGVAGSFLVVGDGSGDPGVAGGGSPSTAPVTRAHPCGLSVIAPPLALHR